MFLRLDLFETQAVVLCPEEFVGGMMLDDEESGLNMMFENTKQKQDSRFKSNLFETLFTAANVLNVTISHHFVCIPLENKM